MHDEVGVSRPKGAWGRSADSNEKFCDTDDYTVSITSNHAETVCLSKLKDDYFKSFQNTLSNEFVGTKNNELCKSKNENCIEKNNTVYMLNESNQNVLDSGTSCLISSVSDDFSTYCNGKVKYKTVTEQSYTDPDSVLGYLKPNPFGLSRGILKKDLPIRRLIPTNWLNANGFDVHLMSEERSYIQSITSSDWWEVRNQFPDLPSLKDDMVFGNGQHRRINVNWYKPLGGVNPTLGEPSQKCRKREIEATEFDAIEHNFLSKLELHRRRAHISVPSVKVRCEECELAKGRKRSVEKVRKPKYSVPEPLFQLDADFMGPIRPESIMKHNFALVMIDPAISYPFVFPCIMKSDAYALVEKLINKLRATDSKSLVDKVVFVVRCDNEKMLRGKQWIKTLQKLKIDEAHSAPYTPQENGVCERYMQTQTNGMKALLVGVDVRLWCYALVWFAAVWVRMPRKKYPRAPQFNGLSPLEARRQRSEIKVEQGTPVVQKEEIPDDQEDHMSWNKENEKHLRRFGCLCYYLNEPRHEIRKVDPKWVKSVFLGFSPGNNPAWLVGTYLPDERCKTHIRWSEIETRDVKFVETVLISDIDSLKPDYRKGVVVSDDKLLQAVCGSSGGKPVVGESTPCAPELTIQRDSGADLSQSTSPRPATGQEINLSNEVSGTDNPVNVTDESNKTTKSMEVDNEIHPEINLENNNISSNDSDTKSDNISSTTSSSNTTNSSSNSESSPLHINQINDGIRKIVECSLEEQVVAEQKEYVAGIDTEDVGKIRKLKTRERRAKRGRPKGSKDKSQRVRRTKEELQETFFGKEMVVEGDEFDNYKFIQSCYHTNEVEGDLEEEEVIENVYLQMSVSEALRSEEAPKWVQAIDKEKTKLIAFKTWRNLSDEELSRAKSAVPVALILTKKRDGTYKCRAVCLGNLYKPDGHLDVYASVITQSANRYMLVDACASGDHLELFDIDNAFVQSFIDTEIFVRLPKTWRNNEKDTGIRKLVKALYGLPQAPRLWAKFYEKKLLELGWKQSLSRGLWKKESKSCPGSVLRLGVFVDDNTISGKDPQEVNSEMQAILKVFPGKVIPAEEMSDGWLRYDLLGTDVWYRKSTRELKITMERYIQKMAQKFRMEGCKPSPSPGFQESLLYDESSPKVNYPVREAIGCLSWAANICRIDICHPVNLLARVTARDTTKSIVACIKKVIRYLVNKPCVGLMYSPENERLFNETYAGLSAEGESLTKWNAFSDASFASCFITMKSVSGSIMYYKAFPIVWKSARQTVRTNSTFESEYVAAADTLTVIESLDFKGFFGDRSDETLWIDNQTAVMVSKTEPGKERPKSRHVALRYMRVSEVKDKIRFCPTQHQKADVLTKCGVSQDVRDHVFTHNPQMQSGKSKKKAEEDLFEVEDMFTTNDQIMCCYISALEYLVDE